MKKRIRFFVGGPAFHPTAEQAKVISGWLGADFTAELRDGAEAFDQLDAVDLLVIMGLHWTGMDAEWAGRLEYRPLSETQKKNLEAYVASGRPILCFHGGIASYNDWPDFGRLIGFCWNWQLTTHTEIGTFEVTVSSEKHPLIEGVTSFKIWDEIYTNIQVPSDVQVNVYAHVSLSGARFPMIISGRGGRIAGAGKTLYLANGHDMKVFAAPEIRPIWCNAVKWLLEK